MVIINVSMTEKPSISDAIMSIRSQRGRVTFCEDIEMDSLEPEVGAKGEPGLGTIKEYENEFVVASVDAFREFDVSVLSFPDLVCDVCSKQMTVSLCSKSFEENVSVARLSAVT
jgi:hypothetical protein